MLRIYNASALALRTIPLPLLVLLHEFLVHTWHANNNGAPRVVGLELQFAIVTTCAFALVACTVGTACASGAYPLVA